MRGQPELVVERRQRSAAFGLHEVCAREAPRLVAVRLAHRVAAHARAQFEEHGVAVAQLVRRGQARQPAAHDRNIDRLARWWKVVAVLATVEGDGVAFKGVAEPSLGEGDSADKLTLAQGRQPDHGVREQARRRRRDRKVGSRVGASAEGDHRREGAKPLKEHLSARWMFPTHRRRLTDIRGQTKRIQARAREWRAGRATKASFRLARVLTNHREMP